MDFDVTVSGIQTAELEWKSIDGIDIPISKQFGDVYFSKSNGLLETQHVFLKGNDLHLRLSLLEDFEYFCVGETGFGTGLNILALWQLWQHVRPNNHSHLHVISIEKYPLRKSDLIRSLAAWPELKPFADQIIEQYPFPIAGCHRLNFPDARFSIDLWLGDAHDVFPTIAKTKAVNAWFLDGFAPSCNPELWEDNILKHMIRLSAIGTTFASFSVAGVLKRGLKAYGIHISRPKGFGHKREMLKGIWETSKELPLPLETQTASKNSHRVKQQKIAIIGAGIAGLTTAWSLALRGHQVTLYEQKNTLSGASGNPLALLNPKLSPIEKAPTHLMTLAWQYALRFYAHFEAFQAREIDQIALKDPEEFLNLEHQYPVGLLQRSTLQHPLIKTTYPSLKLTHAGTITPHQLRDQILKHPNIELTIAKIDRLKEHKNGIDVLQDNQRLIQADQVVVCCAKESQFFFEDYPPLKPIRGQISWLNNEKHPLLGNQAYSYAGYCMQLDRKQLILGASFHPNREDTEVLQEDHLHNLNLIKNVFPDYAEQLPHINTWQGRASIRAQTPDYFPVVGQLQKDSRIFTFAGLGSKGFLFAPLCSELLSAMMLNEACPVPLELIEKLNPQRFFKRKKPKKPYYYSKV